MLNQPSSLGIRTILGLRDLGDSPLDMVAAVRRGISYKAVSRVAEALHLSTGQLAEYLPVTERTLQRYQKAKKNLEYLLKEQNNKDQNGNDKKEGGDQGNSKDKKENESKNNEKKMSDIQARNLLESMKNKPVRKQKGKGDGTKYLEKYW